MTMQDFFHGRKEDSKKPFVYPPTPAELYTYADFYQEPYRTFFKFLYLYGCRTTEALNCQVQDLRRESMEGKDLLVAELLTLKNRKYKRRSLPALMQGVEREMALDILEYVGRAAPEYYLFGFNRQKAYNHISQQRITVRAIVEEPRREIVTLENFRLYPHFLRHCRASHLVSLHGYNEVDLMRFMGWTDPSLSAVYVRLDWKDLARSMIRSGA